MHDEVTIYMSEIGSKYKAYQEQCIEVWMCEVRGEFLLYLCSFPGRYTVSLDQLILKSLSGLLDSISMLNSNHGKSCSKIPSGVYEHLLVSLQAERTELNENLMKLRKNYQKHQVETMSKLGSTQRYLGNQFSALCSKFEAASQVLSENINTLINLYMVCLQIKMY